MDFSSLLESLPWAGECCAKAFHTLRGKVVKNDPYSQINLCDYVGDDALEVLNARFMLCQHLGIELDNLVMPRQVHGTEVRVIDSAFMRAGIGEQQESLEGVDALVTSLPGTCLGVNTADCVPIVFCSPETRIIGVAHAGWRGSTARIAAKTVEAMCTLGAPSSSIMATIGVSICPDCFEVGEEVVEQFAAGGFDIDRIAFRHHDTGKWHINLQEANRLTLIKAGVPETNITVTNLCSRCDPDRYFSARRLGVKSGRTFTGIILDKKP